MADIEDLLYALNEADRAQHKSDSAPNEGIGWGESPLQEDARHAREDVERILNGLIDARVRNALNTLGGKDGL